jgi:hypothetical protein
MIDGEDFIFYDFVKYEVIPEGLEVIVDFDQLMEEHYVK